MDRDISFLTEKQQIVYTLRTHGMKYSEIGKLMKISAPVARQHYLSAEKRIGKYEKHNGINEKNLTPLTIDINLGELKLIISGLMKLKLFMWKNLVRSEKSYSLEEFPSEYKVTEELLERLQYIRKEND